MKRFITILLMAMFPSVHVLADGGLWMVNLVDKVLAARMQEAGMRFDPSAIYDPAKISFSDAVVSLDFTCTASVVSDKGLMITNHHCAYADISALSTEENNYLEDGFWALDMDEEIPVPGRKAYFLRYVIDVTSDVEEYTEQTRMEGKSVNLHRMRYLMEKAVRDETGYEARLSSSWCGEKYYMSLYEVYSDVRLVAAPPAAIASFGGDTDNWQWPQHKGEFAIYRVYAAPDGSPAEYSPDNVPVRPRYFFRISDKGYGPWEFSMILGYPASTDRYSSSFAVKDVAFRINPITIKLKDGYMRIMRKWMSQDRQVMIKYYDKLFSLSNSREYDAGESDNIVRYHILDSIALRESRMQEWVSMSADRDAYWGNLLSDMKEKYLLMAGVSDEALYFRGTFRNGTGLYPYVRALAIHRGRHGDSPKTVTCFQEAFENAGNMWNVMDRRVEKELLEYAVSEFYSNVGKRFWSPFHEYLNREFGDDYAAMVDYVWDNSFFTSDVKYDSLKDVLSPIFSDERSYDVETCDSVCAVLRDRISLYYDPLYQLLRSTDMYSFYSVMSELENGVSVRMLEDEYARLLYGMREDQGVPQYPDANSTMRLSYGKISGYSPRDAVWYSWNSTTDGILQKYDPDNADFAPDGRFMELVRNRQWGRWAAGKTMQVDFLTDNDVAPGNSGSPVLNADGELIGLAFDANEQSLAGSFYYSEDYNKAVCVDIRYILWILDEYAGMDRLLDEMGF